MLYRAHEARPKNGIRSRIATLHRIACVIPIPETNVVNVEQWRGYSDKYVSWVSPNSFKKIQGDAGGKINTLRGDSVGHSEGKNGRMNLCLIRINYLDGAF